VAALATGLIAGSIGADSLADGAVLGIVVWLGFTNQVVNDVYQGNKTDLAKINGPYTFSASWQWE
jgi:hypothetical protein